MNVRFFGGRKEEYISIPKHNPIGLYFCADTRELFLGDRLLSDGLRVVATFADLPSISEHKAAEGVIYFVEDTKNGYVLPRGRSEWLQVIYAPTTGEGAEADLSNYYTKTEVDAAILKAIANIELEVDLAGYATETYVDEKVAAINIPKVPTKLGELENDTGFITEHQDVSHLATKEEVAAIEAEIPSLATKQELKDALSGIEHPTTDLTGYATEDWVTRQGFAKEADIPQAELFIVDFNAPDYAAAVDAYNNGKLLLLTNAAPDVNSYAMMNYVSDKYVSFTKFLMSRSGTYGSFNTYYLHNDNTWELSKEVKLNKVEAVADADNNITGVVIGKNTYDFDNFTTAETVSQITENIKNTYVTNEALEQKNYVTEQYVTNNYLTQEAAETKINTVVETQVSKVVSEEIATKVTEVIEQKVEAGEIIANAGAINYDTWD